jgi:hypothetical protein
MQHLSAESKDEIRDSLDFEELYAETDPEKLWQTIERTHKVDCLSNANEAIELSARKVLRLWCNIVTGFERPTNRIRRISLT